LTKVLAFSPAAEKARGPLRLAWALKRAMAAGENFTVLRSFQILRFSVVKMP